MDRPTSVTYSIDKREDCYAGISNVNGETSSSSTTNSSSSGGQSPVFSNSVSGTTAPSWQLRPDGTYSFDSYAFSNSMFATAKVPSYNRNSNAFARATVKFKMGSASVSP